MSATAQVQQESNARLRYAMVAFCAALLLVGAQLIQFSGPHANVSELTLDLIYDNKRAALNVVGAVIDMLGLFSAGVLLLWLYKISRARNPGVNGAWRWAILVGVPLAAVMTVVYTIVIAVKAHTFATTGDQSYPQAYALTHNALVVALPLLMDLGTLMLTIGTIWIALNAMRVGLLTRMLGYIGVLAGALFLFPIPVLVPVIQGYWLAAVAVLLAARWPSGDPPAWGSGEAVPWPSSGRGGQPAAQRERPARGQRRRVSSQEVLAAVDPKEPRTGAPSPSTSAGKRKRKRK